MLRIDNPRRTFTLIGLAAATALTLSACSSTTTTEPTTEPEAETTEAPATATQWPITFENADGTTTEIPALPENILSTSVTVTGTLLAIDAPVTASASAGNGQFFAQWDDVAQERGVDNVWAAGAIDLEAVYAAEPDLIVVSSSGADSTLDNLADLQAIAPTIVVDYGAQTWQSLALELGEATGLTEEAEATVADFDALVADAATQITVPDGSVNIVSYNGPGETNPIAMVGGSHADLLEALGFTVEDPKLEWHTQANTRSDFVFAAYENLTELTAETTLILSQDNAGATAGFASDATLANVPSVAAGQVFGLGVNSFRIDKFSATEIVEDIIANVGK